MIKKILVISFLLLPLAAGATGLLNDSCIDNGSCDIDQSVQIFLNASQWLLGIVGSLALLFLIYGGLLWMTSGGKSDAIDRGKKIMINTLLGIGVVFLAWTAVNFILTSFGSEKYNSLETITNNGNQATECSSKQPGDFCENGLGICKKVGSDTECVDRCGNESNQSWSSGSCITPASCTSGGGSIVYNKCLGSSQRVCCVPKK